MVTRPFSLGLLVRLFMIVAVWTASGVVEALDAIEVRLDESAAKMPMTGRLFAFFATGNQGEPRLGPNWFKPEPFFAQDVTAMKPGSTHRLGSDADGFPAPLDQLPQGKYRVQAVLHQDFDSPFPGSGVGNPYSAVLNATVTTDTKSLELVLNQVVPAPEFPESSWLKEVVLRSDRLSEFHHRDVVDRATVVLPDDYDKHPDRRYPVIYTIPGFGGSHRDALRLTAPPPVDKTGVGFIRVFLSGRCQWGHHVFADSRINGPRGAALVNEMIPHIDKTFRTISTSTARFVTGHSSGGWSSLWLQVRYPETFGGVWSTAPDPVDFRDYQQVNLYAVSPENMYRDAAGKRRPIARQAGKPMLWYDDFTRMDDVICRGGQLRSFEAVFSPLDAQSSPQRMYDRGTGDVVPEVTKAWEEYDIRLKLERNWATLEPLLRGKLHVVMGDIDTFYLDGAVKRLAETLKELKSDAQVEIIPGADHGSFLTQEFRARIRREMAEQFLKNHKWE